MGGTRRILAGVLLTLLAASVMGSEREPVTAFVGITLISTYGEPHAPNQTVLIRGDRIVAVGDASEIDVPASATVLGRPGQYLAPGLADMHVHLFEASDAVLFLANGVTTVRNLAGRPETTALARRIAAGEAPGPTIYSSSPILNGVDPDRQNPFAIQNPAAMRERVREMTEADANYIGIKLYEDLDPETFVAGVEAAHAHGLQAYGHVPHAMSVDEVLAAKPDSIEHLIGFERALTPKLAAATEEERWVQADMTRAPELAQRIARSGVATAATLVIYTETPRAFADPALAQSAPEYRYATPHQRQRWRENHALVPDPQAMWAMMQKGQPMRLAMVRALHEAGAPLLIGTDAPQPYSYAGFSLHREFELHREAGLEPVDILRIATAGAAGFLRQDSEFGVIAVRARADVLLLDGNPEANMDLLRAPAGVMAAGQWRDAATLRELLVQVAAAD